MTKGALQKDSVTGSKPAAPPAGEPLKSLSPQGEKRAFVVDDHPLVREWLSHILQNEAGVSVCGEAEDANDALAKIAELRPDIVVADIALKKSNGLELVKTLQGLYPSLPVLVLSMYDESLYAERALRAGARGYVAKQEATKRIAKAIWKVLAGEVYVSERISSQMVSRSVQGRSGNAKSSLDLLSDRELEVFRLLGRGRATSKIAEELKVSIKTVECYRARTKEKLKLKDGTQLLQHAIQWVHELEDGGPGQP